MPLVFQKYQIGQFVSLKKRPEQPWVIIEVIESDYICRKLREPEKIESAFKEDELQEFNPAIA